MASNAASSSITPVKPALLEQHSADLHMELEGDGALCARASLWWRSAPQDAASKFGLIGHFAAASRVEAVELLDAACDVLRETGCGRAIGPADGNTWRSYRAITDRGTEPLFFLEPDTPAGWNEYFLAAGFEVLATYHSSICTTPFERDPRIAPAADRLLAAGVSIREIAIDPLDRFEAELGAIYDLSIESFARNFLYSPIGRDEFVQQYLPIAPLVDPRFTLVAEHAGHTVGFLFAVPDRLEVQRTTRAPRTLIIKTVAVEPSRRFAGLGAYLVALAHERAERLDYRRVIHALMHDSNKSSNISARYGQVMRRYALYSRSLE